MLTAMKSKSYFILTLLLLLSVQLNAGWQRPQKKCVTPIKD